MLDMLRIIKKKPLAHWSYTNVQSSIQIISLYSAQKWSLDTWVVQAIFQVSKTVYFFYINSRLVCQIRFNYERRFMDFSWPLILLLSVLDTRNFPNNVTLDLKPGYPLSNKLKPCDWWLICAYSPNQIETGVISKKF